jgi:hypothetical protein
MMPGDNAPPVHPNCRCSTAAWEDDEEYEAWLDYLDKGGSTAEWKKTGKKEWEKLNKALENSKNIDTMKMSKIGIQFFAKMAKEKFLDYSLNPLKAPDKAKAFKEALGYTLDNYEDLMQNIKEHIDESKFVEKGDNGHGMLYEYIVRIKGPNGKSANVLTAWIQEGDEKRLVSVYVTERKVTE